MKCVSSDSVQMGAGGVLLNVGAILRSSRVGVCSYLARSSSW